jgi:hypothetical protein
MPETLEGNGTEEFAFYGFKLNIPKTFRVEFNPKGSRERCDVVFHSPKRNRIYVSWGPLEAAQKRFKTLEEHRDYAISELKKARGVRSLSVVESSESTVCGHRVLTTRVSAHPSGGILAPRQPEREMSSAHFYCKEGNRYYVMYSILNFPPEYSDFEEVFDSVVRSAHCHGTAVP